jgi:putative heme-binding domain-containing protein
MTGIFARSVYRQRSTAIVAVRFTALLTAIFSVLPLFLLTAEQGRAAEKIATQDERSESPPTNSTTGPLVIEPRAHVVIVGNTLAERMQYYGHWETLLHERFPRHELYVRNLGWSADEVNLRPRSQNFGEHGHTLADHKPDLLLAMFGFNESFAGAAGLSRFQRELDDWLREVTTTKYNGRQPPTVVLCSPIAHENLQQRFLPDGAATNRNLALYTAAMRDLAARRSIRFVDLFEPSRRGMESAKNPWTINGIHLNADGDRQVAAILDQALFGAPLNRNPTSVDQQRDANGAERLRAAVNEKNQQFFYDLRAVNGFYIYGGRRNPFGTVSFPPEFAKLRKMTAVRDRRIWDLAQGRSVPAEIDDRETGELPTISSNFKAPIKITTPEESRRQMQLAEGFEVNLFASEVEFPDLANPVQFAFDARGRLWVSTMPSYPQLIPGQKPNDKILILEDTDGDGKADKQTIFADGLYLPTGLELGDGGVYVAQQPNLMFLQDTDGDDRADRRELILHGFDSADSHHAISAFTWDQGGALYFEEGTFLHSQIETPYGPTRLANAGVFRFEPRTGRLSVFVSYRFANPWGHTIDRWGQNYIADASPGFNYFGAAISGDVDYPRKHATAPQLFEKQWRPTAGCELVSSRNFPDDMQGDYLLNNCIGFQGVLRYRLRDEGSAVVGQAADPLLSSRDLNFRPVDIEFGPDGALYLCDWFNPLVGHMQHSIRDPGRDQSHGRIWRVRYTKKSLAKPVPIAGATIEGLLAVLRAAPDERTCYRVRTELRSRDSEQVRTAVDRWLAESDRRSREGAHDHLEGLWLRQQHDQVDERLLDAVLKSSEPRARAAAVRVLCYWHDRLPAALDKLAHLIQDEHPRVRLEALRALSFFRGDQVERALTVAADALQRPFDEHLRYVLRETWATLDGRLRSQTEPSQSRDFVRPVSSRLRAGDIPTAQLPLAVELVCQYGGAEDLTLVFEKYLVASKDALEVRVQIVDALIDAATNRKLRPTGDIAILERLLTSPATQREPALERGLRRLASLWQVASIAAQLREVLLNPRSEQEAIRTAVRDLAALDDPNSRELLKELTTRESPSMRVRLQALAAYAKLAPEAAAPAAAAALSEAAATDRVGDLLDAFLSLKVGPRLLATAIPKRPLHADTAKMALRHLYSVGCTDPELTRVFSEAAGVAVDTAPPTAAELQRLAADAAQRGDARRGELIFRRADLSCLRCHALQRAGGNVGPELTAVGSISPIEYLAASVLDPNQAIKEQYVTRVIVTERGETFTGVLIDRNETRVNLRDATGKTITIPVEEIDEEAEGRSLMPQGLTKFLTQDELLDLIKFLSELGRPGPYAMRTDRTVQRWRGTTGLGDESVAQVMTRPASRWTTHWSMFDGRLPLADLRSSVTGNPPAAWLLASDMRVTTAGKIRLLIASPEALQWYLDGQTLELKGDQDGASMEVDLELSAGVHVLQVRVPSGVTGELRVELQKVAGSAAQVELVRGE